MTSSITFDFTQREYRQAMQLLAMQRGYKVIIAIVVCSLLVSALTIFRVSQNGVENTSFASGYLLLMVIAFYAFLVFGVPWLHSRDKLNQNIFQPTTVRCEENRFVIELENGFSESVPYDHIVKTMQNKRYAFYWKNSVDSVILPQHAFPSDETYRAQVDAINSKLKI